MSTFALYEIHDEQSGRIFPNPTSGLVQDTLANCEAGALLLAPQYPERQFTVIPVGYSVTSSRPLQPGRPAAGQLPVIEAYT